MSTKCSGFPCTRRALPRSVPGNSQADEAGLHVTALLQHGASAFGRLRAPVLCGAGPRRRRAHPEALPRAHRGRRAAGGRTAVMRLGWPRAQPVPGGRPWDSTRWLVSALKTGPASKMFSAAGGGKRGHCHRSGPGNLAPLVPARKARAPRHALFGPSYSAAEPSRCSRTAAELSLLLTTEELIAAAVAQLNDHRIGRLDALAMEFGARALGNAVFWLRLSILIPPKPEHVHQAP